MTHRRDTRLADAAAASAAQRERLRVRIAATRERFLPARLKSDAASAAEKLVSDTAAEAMGQARRHPVATGAAVAGLVAWLFREPLLRHGPDRLRRGYDWLAGHLPLSEEAQQSGRNKDDRQTVEDTTDAEEQERLPHG